MTSVSRSVSRSMHSASRIACPLAGVRLSSRRSFSASPLSRDAPSSSIIAQTPPSKPRTILSGIQPSGTIHLGNYLGAISTWTSLQRTSQPQDSIFYSIVGLHAITLPQDPKKLLKERREMMASLLACGIDPERSCLFHQDMVPEHTELAWVLNCITSVGKLQRMTTWKSKIATFKNASSEDHVSESDLQLGLLAYPVLQAADILIYKATHVPVGEDQAQHLELTRDIAETFNRTFKKTFPLPQSIITPAKKILSLRNPPAKMSKSSPDLSSRILLTDSPSQIASKIRSAVTDSDPIITFSPETRPGISNLLTILAACAESDGPAESQKTPEDYAKQYRDWDKKDFKLEVSDAIEARLGPIRRELDRIRGDEGYLRTVGEKGAEKARERAGRVLSEVKEKVGLGSI